MQGRHGGDIYHNEVVIDYSVNINPLGMEEHVEQAMIEAIRQCVQYPDLECLALKEELAQHYHVLREQVICGNGASDLFMAITRWIQPKNALVLAPSFSGYTHALQAVGSSIEYVRLAEEASFCLTEDFLEHLNEPLDICFLCTPNNPTGTVIEPDLLQRIIKRCKEKRIYLVIDQCFLEFTGEYERLCAEQFLEGNDYIIIVNAFTKTFAIPGVRIGFAFACEKIAMGVAGQLAEWNISIPAMAAGLAALKTYKEPSPTYMEKAIALLKTERSYLQGELQRLGITYYDSRADYILIKTKMPLYTKLLQQGILIRHCNNYENLGEDYYRIAIKQHWQNEQLIEAIERVQIEL